ncbi:CARDB domain-containing protein, partial [Limnospira sp. PMC 1306.21]|uniref:CARDB domain-containing protein n=1 Tax=Limnospira sp. PMC 1306.21 TaxID=2981089 RepID=UPI0028E1144F
RGERVTFGWTVENKGSGAAVASWYDAVYVSDSASFDASTATRLVTTWAGSHTPLAPGGSYDSTTSVVLPSGLTGAAWFHFVVDY